MEIAQISHFHSLESLTSRVSSLLLLHTVAAEEQMETALEVTRICAPGAKALGPEVLRTGISVSMGLRVFRFK